MIVITLTKTPISLRGDLTKWCQEIQTGVYVGNFSARIRELLWHRIQQNIGNGEATLVYTTNNELGYTFKTTREDAKVIDFDGIPLIMHLKPNITYVKHGFSNAAKWHKARRFTQVKVQKSHFENNLVAIDLETTGINPDKAKIISIGAVKRNGKGHFLSFYRLIRIDSNVPEQIIRLTGLNNAILNKQGISLTDALKELKNFIEQKIIIGYNLPFDASFLMKACLVTKQATINNTMKDLMPIVKTKNKFLDNYQLKTVLEEYKIPSEQQHNALQDAEATFQLAIKLNKKYNLKI